MPKWLCTCWALKRTDSIHAETVIMVMTLLHYCISASYSVIRALATYKSQLRDMGIPIPGQQQPPSNTAPAPARKKLQEPPGLNESQKRLWSSFADKVLPTVGIAAAKNAFKVAFQVRQQQQEIVFSGCYVGDRVSCGRLQKYRCRLTKI